ncbi:DUF1571 domain-containing protein [Planctomicrobium sp. SH668]|uniref:DUF1571 domain-containing protein n=1 Tax=Planctomicrobium sp. SH668 TaxID=3448126 RepID=UPI003F5B3475
MRQSKPLPNPYCRNFLACAVATGAFGLAQLNLSPFSIDGRESNMSVASAAAPRLTPPPPSLPVQIAQDSTTPAPETPAAAPQADPTTLQGIWAIKMASTLLENGAASFAKVPDYTAKMCRQERIGGELGDFQVVDVKIRHEPFSVYMKWSEGDRGRQLIYVRGENNGNMLVQPGGMKGRLTGVLNLEPTGTLAMAETRYSIEKAGLLELARTVLSFQKADLNRGKGYQCQLLDNQEFEGRKCFLYHIEYEGAEYNEFYRKSLIYIDKELSLPICVKNYTWGVDVNPETIDDETLIEYYSYTDLKFTQNLTASHFDKYNQDYRLRVR